MSRRLIILPEAEAEITDAIAWYEQRVEALGEAFLRELEATVERIRENPHQYQVVFEDVRRAMLRRFPCALMYRASEQELVVAACFHCGRDPRRWRPRISRR